MSDTAKKFYLTTPIYYVNARPHIGHAYTTIAADVIARRQRTLLGDENVWFLTGTDEHGQKVQRSAQAAGITPQQFTDEISQQFRALWQRMGITNNDYIRTTEPRHTQGVQRLFNELYQRGHIYLDTYTGQYSVGEEMFVEGPPGTIGPDGKPTETVTEENFYFRLSAFQTELIDRIEADEDDPKAFRIEPEARRNEVLSFLRGDVNNGAETKLSAKGTPYAPGALKDLSISRSSFDWGIPVPEPAASTTQKEHVIYVWFDAIANYMTAIGYGSEDPAQQAQFKKFWPADLHLVGKEIIRFHCVYWPAFLLAAGLPLPKKVQAHGWLLFEESKMSKSRGNIVRTETILDAFGSLKPKPIDLPGAPLSDEYWKHEQDLFASDVLRYFLLREIPFGQDGSFSFDALVQRYNSDLANGYGNLVSRTLSMINKYFDGHVNPSGDKVSKYPFAPANLTRYITGISGVIALVDKFISDKAPWKVAADPDEDAQLDLEEILYTAAESIRIITALLHPILPYTTAKIWEQLGLGSIEASIKAGELSNLQWGGLQKGVRLAELSPIFPRAPKELIQVMTDAENNTATPTPSKLIDEKTNHTAAAPDESTHPGAAPRTSALPSDNPGTQVGASSAAVTELSKPPAPHTEAHASGVFSADAAAATPQIAIDDFAKVDLRVARVLVAERIPKADKLLRLEVDLGTEKRQILSGIAEWYAPEELIGRRIIVIANLAPRKMRGLESHGMLLAASEGENGKPILATFAEGDDIAPGSRLK
jgi:methionyl-tRNA synthetase